MIGGVGDQEVSNGKGEYPCQDEGDVVADKVEKCGSGCAGNGMVVFMVVHVMVYPSCFFEDGRLQMSDFGLQTFDV